MPNQNLTKSQEKLKTTKNINKILRLWGNITEVVL